MGDERKFSSEQLDELRSCFAIFDVDSSGLISTNELKNVLELLNVKLNNEEVNVLMETIDADHSGQIDFEEFKNLMSDIVLKTPTKAQLEEAFRFFDLDNSGFISEIELYNVLKRFKSSINIEDVRRIVDVMDKNHDSLISIDEFISAMME